MEMYKRREEWIYEHNGILFNINMNYFTLFFHTLSKTKH